MKFLVLFACVAAASAQVQLVNYPNGAVAPAKTPEVLAAEQAHFAAKGLPYAGLWNGAYGGYAGYGAGYGGLWNGYAGAGYAGAYAGAGFPYGAYGAYGGAYPGGYGYPWGPALVGHPNGAVVPAEPADVVAARAAHLAAHGAPLVGPAAAIAPYYAPGFAGLVAHPNGALVPAEPADVVEARAAHLATHG
jgi:hypothetical protein